MKKLLLFALALTSLAAHAQTNEVARASRFCFVPGTLSCDGKAFPVSIENGEEGRADITIYDNNFNKKQNATISLPYYKMTRIKETSAPIEFERIMDEDNCEIESVMKVDADSVLNTPDDFIRHWYYTSRNEIYNYETLKDYKADISTFTDDKNRIIIIRNSKINAYYSNCPNAGKSLPYCQYYDVPYFDKANNTKGTMELAFWIYYDINQISGWSPSGESFSDGTRVDETITFDFIDADNNIHLKDLRGTQTLFNSDNNVEFIKVAHKEISSEEYWATQPQDAVEAVIKGNELTLKRSGYANYYKKVLDVIDEKGNSITELGSGISDISTIVKMNGNLYFINYESGEEIVYAYSEATGIKEIARAKASTNTKSYNLAGQQVRPETMGVIIRNGKKFINK